MLAAPLNTLQIKQFVLTSYKYGATRFNSNQNSKNRILIPIDTSKESDFNCDFKYISFIKFSPTHQKLSAWEYLADFQKKGERPPKSYGNLMKITPSDSACQRTSLKKFQAPIYKNGDFFYFCMKTGHGCVFFFFSGGDCIEIMVLEDRVRVHLNEN